MDGDAGNEEALATEPTAVVAAVLPLIAVFGTRRRIHNGTDAFTFRIAFSAARIWAKGLHPQKSDGLKSSCRACPLASSKHALASLD